MRQVAIIGIGQTAVEEHWDRSLRDIAVQAIVQAMNEAGREKVDGIFVGNMMSGILSHQENLGALIADWSGMPGVEAFKVEAACGSGSAGGDRETRIPRHSSTPPAPPARLPGQ